MVDDATVPVRPVAVVLDAEVLVAGVLEDVVGGVVALVGVGTDAVLLPGQRRGLAAGCDTDGVALGGVQGGCRRLGGFPVGVVREAGVVLDLVHGLLLGLAEVQARLRPHEAVVDPVLGVEVPVGTVRVGVDEVVVETVGLVHVARLAVNRHLLRRNRSGLAAGGPLGRREVGGGLGFLQGGVLRPVAPAPTGGAGHQRVASAGDGGDVAELAPAVRAVELAVVLHPVDVHGDSVAGLTVDATSLGVVDGFRLGLLEGVVRAEGPGGAVVAVVGDLEVALEGLLDAVPVAGGELDPDGVLPVVLPLCGLLSAGRAARGGAAGGHQGVVGGLLGGVDAVVDADGLAVVGQQALEDEFPSDPVEDDGVLVLPERRVRAEVLVGLHGVLNPDESGLLTASEAAGVDGSGGVLGLLAGGVAPNGGGREAVVDGQVVLASPAEADGVLVAEHVGTEAITLPGDMGGGATLGGGGRLAAGGTLAGLRLGVDGEGGDAVADGVHGVVAGLGLLGGGAADVGDAHVPALVEVVLGGRVAEEVAGVLDDAGGGAVERLVTLLGGDLLVVALVAEGLEGSVVRHPVS